MIDSISLEAFGTKGWLGVGHPADRVKLDVARHEVGVQASSFPRILVDLGEAESAGEAGAHLVAVQIGFAVDGFISFNAGICIFIVRPGETFILSTKKSFLLKFLIYTGCAKY
jgi:hypothetical protein